MEEKKIIGNKGEDMACDYLRKNGLYILKRNVRNKLGEIDIVAKEKNGTVVFVEVKTMKCEVENFLENKNYDLQPEDNMTSAKIKKFQRACLLFLAENKNFIDEERGYRLDALTLTISENNVVFGHYENI